MMQGFDENQVQPTSRVIANRTLEEMASSVIYLKKMLTRLDLASIAI